jgi:sugar lactone lactonase YvrE
LNETHYANGAFGIARNSLPLVRTCDPTRFVLLSSGRWDKDLGLGSGSNPGSAEWNVYLGDEHPGGKVVGKENMGDVHRYPRVPHNFEAINLLRNLGKGLRNGVFLSEYGVGSSQHLPNILELHRQHGGQQMEMYRWFTEMNARFMADWKAWKMDAMYGSPGDFFDASLAVMAPERLIGINAVRANPYLIGYSVTSLLDLPTSGEGVLDSQRRPKPGVSEVMRDVWAPLRLCSFVEPYNLYRGQSVKLETVLANEDVLRSGSYQAELSIVDKTDAVVWHKTVALVVPEGEAPLAIPFFSENVVADWPAGKYRLTVRLAGRTDAAGGEAVFYVGDKADMPAVNAQVTLWGRDEDLRKWLETAGIKTVPYSTNAPNRRELILVGQDRPADFTGESFPELARRVSSGSTVVFLSHLAWTSQNREKTGVKQAILWPPLMQEAKTSVRSLPMWLYHADHWAKKHPVFAGMPAGGMLDHVYYREILGDLCLSDAPPPTEAIAGANYTAAIFGGYHSGLTLASYDLGAGRFFINTLQISDNLGKVPSAELLLRNLLNYAARDMNKPLVELSPDVDQALKECVVKVNTLMARDLIEPSAKVDLIADGFDFTEGPVCDKQGNLYFSDIPASRIYVWSVENKLSVFREPSGRANGLRFDHDGNLLACEGAARRVTVTSPAGTVTVLADRYQGKKLNSPNDLWVDPKGGIYFTDPRYPSAPWVWSEKNSLTKRVDDPECKEEQEIRGLYYLPPNGKPLRRFAEKFINPNGVFGTADGKRLYVGDTDERKTYMFNIQEDGSLTDRKVVIPDYSDGITLDERGNIYLTNGGVNVYTPDGQLITIIKLPERAANVGFGGKDGRTLFITARKGLYSIRMKVRGQ